MEAESLESPDGADADFVQMRHGGGGAATRAAAGGRARIVGVAAGREIVATTGGAIASGAAPSDGRKSWSVPD
jgi:hypothetical protein